MKICVSASKNHIESNVDPRFGRAEYFLLVDSESMDWEAFENPAVSAGGGAGIKAAQFIVEKKAQVVITGNMGPNAMDVFKAAQIKVYTVDEIGIKKAIDKYNNNELSELDIPRPKNFGMGLQE